MQSVVVGPDVDHPDGDTAGPQWRIIELNGRGHRLWYVSLLLRQIQEVDRGARVELVTVPDVVDSPGWREHISPWLGVLGSKVCPVEQSRLSVLLAAAHSRSRVVIPDADTWLVPLLAVRFRSARSLNGSILLMRSQPNFELGSKVRHALKKILIGVLRVAHPGLTISALAAVEKPGQASVLLDPVAFSPSGQTREQWLDRQGLAPARKWLVVLGEVSERKCVGLILDALTTDSAVAAGWALLVIGKPSNPVLNDRLNAMSDRHPDTVVFRDQFVSDVEFDTWVSVADAVSVLYKNEGSSGVLLKCWAAGAMVVVGGSDSVLTAARSLEMKRVEVSDLSSQGILEALLAVGPRSAGQVPARAQWQGRSDHFARTLLGLE